MFELGHWLFCMLQNFFLTVMLADRTDFWAEYPDIAKERFSAPLCQLGCQAWRGKIFAKTISTRI
jgi:hypothetical protein